MVTRKADPGVDFARARQRLDEIWAAVAAQVEREPEREYVDDAAMREKIRACVNHTQVSYRFCLPVQLLGKVLMPHVDALALQRGKDAKDKRAWDARSLASRVVAPFNQAQENVLGSSADPYVGNAMRIPRMRRGDASKKDLAGWHTLIDVLQWVEKSNDPQRAEAALNQVLLEFHRRQKSLRFDYPVPRRVSLANALRVMTEFVGEGSGGDRALALAGALFEVIGARFGLYARVGRAPINATDEASGQAADLECVDANDRVVLAVEVKDRALTLADVEGTINKARLRDIGDVLFAAPLIKESDRGAVAQRFAAAFASGQNLYHADLIDLASTVLALSGETGRKEFLQRVGEHLNEWNTQPRHRQAWKTLLESL
jgi:hypothetical protein